MQTLKNCCLSQIRKLELNLGFSTKLWQTWISRDILSLSDYPCWWGSWSEPYGLLGGTVSFIFTMSERKGKVHTENISMWSPEIISNWDLIKKPFPVPNHYSPTENSLFPLNSTNTSSEFLYRHKCRFLSCSVSLFAHPLTSQNISIWETGTWWMAAKMPCKSFFWRILRIRK
jgi:hypothetical protein